MAAAGAGAPATTADEVLLLAMSEPRLAARTVADRLHATSGNRDRSALLQAWGIALREMGDYRGAARLLRRAVAAGDRAHDPDRSADARASYGTALTLLGRVAQAMAVFDDATALATDPVTAARIEMRRAACLGEVGRHTEALEVYRRCIRLLRRVGDEVWVARAVGNQAFSQVMTGDVRRAEAGLLEAAEVLRAAGQRQEVALRLHNLAILQTQLGRLPAALATFDEAERLYWETGRPPAVLVADRCRALLEAGMPHDARLTAEGFLDRVEGPLDLYGTGVLLLAAEASLSDQDPGTAAAQAHRAVLAARRSGGAALEQASRLTELRARALLGRGGAALGRRLEVLVEELERSRAPELPAARLFAVRTALRNGHRDAAERHARSLATRSQSQPPLRRVEVALARALLAEHDGDGRGLIRSVHTGLRLLDEHRATLGATELRAYASRHGTELAGLAVRHAADHGSARDLLRRTERWRSAVLDLPTPPPDVDRGLDADLAALRQVVSRLREARSDGRPTAALGRDRRRLEERVRHRSLTRSGAMAGPAAAALSVPHLLDALGDAALVSITGLGGRAEVVVAGGGRVRRVAPRGTEAQVRSATDHALFVLRTVAAGGPFADRMLAALHAGLAELQELLLGDAVRLLGDGPVVVVPPARLQSLPWDALPALRDRTVGVSPSASSWLRARAAHPPRTRRVVLVGAPGLEHADAEVRGLAGVHPTATVLGGAAARTEGVLDALDGAWLAHVAAHGTYRGDNPLFSALELADGPLTVYDLERLRRAPYRLVLTSCESAVGSPVGADELLGLTTALIGTGTAGLLASIVPVDDAATGRFSVRVHERLAAGDGLPEALRHVRQRAVEPVDVGTAYAFLALGAV